jgi:hypothetical protein
MSSVYEKFIESIYHEKNTNERVSNIQSNKERNNNRFFDKLYPSYTEMISDIIIYVILVCNILTILFFTLIKDIEGDIVKKQINYLLDDIFNIKSDDKNDNNESNGMNNIIKTNNQDIQTIYNKWNDVKNTYKNEIIKKLNETATDNESEKLIKENNDKIFNKSLLVLGIVNGICIIILFILWKYNKFDIMYYIKKNFILGIFVIITELVFLFAITKNYIYIDKKYVMMETMKKISKQ